MKTGKFRISGAGCALADFLYNGIDFSSEQFARYQSRLPGDGGLNPGGLVFTEELERFAGKSYREILTEITGGKSYDAFNLGGPALVSLINAAQLLDENVFTVCYYGNLGNDKTTDLILSLIGKTPLDASGITRKGSLPSPFTDVLSDPLYDNGHGERTFVNNIGAAWDFSPYMLPDEFFNSEIVAFGGTALVPQIHDNLDLLLAKAKQNGCITIVNTVFDFRNEKRYPGKPWPLVADKENMRLINILIMDKVEALKISGKENIDDAAEYFSETGIPSFIITDGPSEITAFSDGTFFEKKGFFRYPVLRTVSERNLIKGDTTGCGDNFAGGIIASVAQQKNEEPEALLDIDSAMSLAVASGAFTCTYLGGTYYEKYRYEKKSMIDKLIQEYTKQIRRNG